MLNGYFSNNSQRNRASQNSPQFARDSRFDSNWGKASPVEKPSLRPTYGQGAGEAIQDLHNEILNGCQVNKMRPVSAHSQPPASVPQPQPPSVLRTVRDKGDSKKEEQIRNVSPRDMLILFFELLKMYAHDYNNAVGLGPFYLELSRPHPVLDRMAQSARSSDQVRLQSSFSTSTHTLILQSEKDAVRFYVVSLERAMGLDEEDKGREPECWLQAKRERNSLNWETRAGMPLTMTRVDATCRALFQWLIERTADRVAGDDCV